MGLKEVFHDKLTGRSLFLVGQRNHPLLTGDEKLNQTGGKVCEAALQEACFSRQQHRGGKREVIMEGKERK